VALAETGRSWGLADVDLSGVLDPMNIVATRSATGGAAPAAVATMIAHCRERADELAAAVTARRADLRAAIEALLDQARATAEEKETP
jgi:argininosuccinate lyase